MDSTLLIHAAEAVAAIGLLGTGLGMVLGVAARYLSTPADDRAEAVAALLPGSNCAQCGFAGCSQYVKGFGSLYESINSRAVGLKFCHDRSIAH